MKNLYNKYFSTHIIEKFIFLVILQFIFLNCLNAQITGFGDVNITNTSNSRGAWTKSGSVITFNPTSNTCDLAYSEIQNNLNTQGINTVVISTICATCSEDGKITISSPIISINKSQNRRLKISANKDIIVNNIIDLAAKDGLSNARAQNNGFDLELVSDIGNIITSNTCTIRTDPENINTYRAGAVNFTAKNGSVQINCIILTTSFNTGGPVTIFGNNGVTISSNITTTGGTSGILKITNNKNTLTTLTDLTNQGQIGGVFNVASFEKTGSGIFQLKGKNIWTGNTDITGSIILGADSSLPSTSNIIFNAGTLIPNGFTQNFKSIKVTDISYIIFDPTKSESITFNIFDYNFSTANKYIVVKNWQGFSQDKALDKYGSLVLSSNDFVTNNGSLQKAASPGGLNEFGQILTSSLSGGLKGKLFASKTIVGNDLTSSLNRIKFLNNDILYNSTQISANALQYEIIPGTIMQ